MGTDVMQKNKEWLQQFGNEHPTFLDQPSTAASDEEEES